jgi:hypothetical protein
MNMICAINSSQMQKILPPPSVTPIPELLWYKLNNNIFNYKVTNSPILEATCNTIPAYTASRLPGINCYSFSGGTSSNWLNLPAFARTPTLTFSCWINVQTFAIFSRVFDFGGTFRIHIVNATSLRFNDAYTVTYATTFQNAWKHILFTVNGTTLTFYENAAVKTTFTMTAPLSTVATIGYIAHSYASGDVNPAAKYADLRVYNRVISNAEIVTLFNN